MEPALKSQPRRSEPSVPAPHEPAPHEPALQEPAPPEEQLLAPQLQPRPDRIAVGVDVGGSGIKAAVVDVDRGVLAGARHRVTTPQPSTPDTVVPEIIRTIRLALRSAGFLADRTSRRDSRSRSPGRAGRRSRR